MNTSVIRLAFFIMLFSVTDSISIAADCRPHEEKNESSIICQCGSDLKKLKIHIPSGLKLYTVCGLYSFSEGKPINLKDSKSTYSKEIGGDWYFKGDAVFEGTITKGAEVNRGNLYFYPNKKSAKSLNYSIDFQDEKAVMRFGATSYSADKFWCAPVTIRIKRMKYIEWDSESRGAYALDYEVLEVGKYKQCKSPN